jgi:hypothetical protein
MEKWLKILPLLKKLLFYSIQNKNALILLQKLELLDRQDMKLILLIVSQPRFQHLKQLGFIKLLFKNARFSTFYSRKSLLIRFSDGKVWNNKVPSNSKIDKWLPNFLILLTYCIYYLGWQLNKTSCFCWLGNNWS